MFLPYLLSRFKIPKPFRKHSLGHRRSSINTESSNSGIDLEDIDRFEDCFDTADSDHPDESRYSIGDRETPAYPLSFTYERYQNSIETFQKGLPEEVRRRSSSWHMEMEIFIQFLQLFIDEYDSVEADRGPRGWPLHIKEVATVLLIRVFQDLDFRDYHYLRKQRQELVRLRSFFADESRYKPEILINLDIIIEQLKEFDRRQRKLDK